MSGSFDGFDFLQQRVAVLSVQGLNCQQGLAAEQGEDLLAQFVIGYPSTVIIVRNFVCAWL